MKSCLTVNVILDKNKVKIVKSKTGAKIPGFVVQFTIKNAINEICEKKVHKKTLNFLLSLCTLFREMVVI